MTAPRGRSPFASPIVRLGSAFLIVCVVVGLYGRARNSGVPAPVDEVAIADAVRGSDDWQIYRESFHESAARLIRRGTCTIADFRDAGGWMRAAPSGGPPRYFIHCGGMTAAHRIYYTPSTRDFSR